MTILDLDPWIVASAMLVSITAFIIAGYKLGHAVGHERGYWKAQCELHSKHLKATIVTKRCAFKLGFALAKKLLTQHH